jgi:hypothetical protein
VGQLGNFRSKKHPQNVMKTASYQISHSNASTTIFNFFTGIKLHMYMKIWQWIIDMQSDWGGIINPSQTIGYLCPIIMLPAVLETHWKKYPWIKEDSNQLQMKLANRSVFFNNNLRSYGQLSDGKS